MILDKGIVKIYGKEEAGTGGNKADGPVVLKGSLWYGERTVGITRYWAAQQVNETVKKVIRVLRGFEIDAADTCLIGKDEYRILQVQPLKDDESGEPIYDLSLAKEW